MRMQGIFGGFGAADLGSQNLSLRSIGASGALQPTPLAQAMQTVLRDGDGYSNLQVDGLWGDCSEKAFQDSYAAPSDGPTVAALLGLSMFGVSESAVKGWGKSNPQCSDASQPARVQQWDPTFAPEMVVAKVFGVPVPPNLCKTGTIASPSTMQCKCPAGQFLSTETGECQGMESPPKMPAGTSLASRIRGLSFRTQLKLTPQTFDRPTYVLPAAKTEPSSDGKTTILPGSALTSTGPVSLTRQTFASLYPIRQRFDSMNSGTKVMVGVGAVALLAAIVGGVWWMNRDSSAVPNCGE